MSTLSQFAGGRIKSIQRSSGILNNNISSTVTINAVDTTKTIINVTGAGCTDATRSGDFPLMVLTNSTTVSISRSIGNASGPYSFEVVEFY